ncbi:MAG TPA: Rod shape-determining protein MreD [Cyclobacteriaceae bacterium]|nr:Rod shape-determining protein MreD [Cyclobacteriaceae bacterium]
MSRLGIGQIISFFIYLALQVFVMKNVVLFHTAFCFIYVAYLLLLPVESNTLLLMAIGFLMGFIIDIFYDSLGMHASASVLIMYMRNYWLNLITPQGGYDSNAVPTLAMNGIQWFAVYTAPLVFLHHMVLFFIEAGGFGIFWFTLGKVFASTLLTILVILIIQFLFGDRKRL